LDSNFRYKAHAFVAMIREVTFVGTSQETSPTAGNNTARVANRWRR
jgi:hypothetical protein